jgi:sulfur-oxidizing protein SoxY
MCDSCEAVSDARAVPGWVPIVTRSAATQRGADPAAHDAERRNLLISGGLAAALVACGFPRDASAAMTGDDEAFAATSTQDALGALGPIAVGDPRMTLTLPDVAENGAVVPVTVECRIPRVSEVYVVVDSNPNPMAVRFGLHEGVDPLVSLRIKMAGGGTVHALARADGKVYATSRTTQVTVGGCG